MRLYLAILPLLAAFPALALSDPLTLKPSDDTYLSAGVTGLPGGRGERKEFQIYGKPNHRQFRALLKFDLSAVKRPPMQALLRIRAWNIGRPKKTELIRCHPVLRDWNEQFASWDRCLKDDGWSNAGGDWDPTPVAGCNVTPQMGGEKGWWFEFDVTALVQAWVLKRRPNYGFALLFDPDCSSEVRFRSKEYGSNAPELKLAWRARLPRGARMVPGHKIKPYGKPVRMEPVWAVSALNMVKAGEAFSQKLRVRGGARPYQFSARGLPEGVTLTGDGTLSGTAAKAGRFAIRFTCQGADRRRSSKRLELVVQKTAPAVAGGGSKKPGSGKARPKKTADEEEEE